MSKSQIFNVPEVSLEDLENIVNLPRISGVKFTEFSYRTQKFLGILSAIGQFAHTHRQYKIIQKVAFFVLNYVWDPTDKPMFDFIYSQTDVFYLLANSLVDRLAPLNLDREQQESWERDTGETGVSDPRALGISNVHATEEMVKIKKLIVASITSGINLALSVKDEYGYQNGAIFAWNLHIHVFRKEMYTIILPELSALVKLVYSSMETFKSVANGSYLIDEKLRACYIESNALISFQSGDVGAAVEIVNKSSASGTPYIRRKLCELAGKLASAPVPVAAKGGKVR